MGKSREPLDRENQPGNDRNQPDRTKGPSGGSPDYPLGNDKQETGFNSSGNKNRSER